MGHKNKINSFVYLEAKEEVWSLANDRSIRVWDKDSDKCKLVIRLNYSGICAQLFPPIKQLVVACDDKLIRCFSTKTNNVMKKFAASKKKILCFALAEAMGEGPK